MDSFRTVVNPLSAGFEINYSKTSFWIGSCFTENIGSRLKELKFKTLVNPFGVLYNPESIKNSLDIIIDNRTFTEQDLCQNNGLWYSFYHHSSFSHSEKERCLRQINSSIEESNRMLKETDLLFITFGTSRVYRLRDTGKIVSNCHKLPQDKFSREMLDVPEIVASYIELVERLITFNPDLKIIFTLSPVRHWKDGPTGNLLSKSVLILSISKLLEEYANIFYFPAYEIVMDDLRDYRFYAEDMLHINKTAIEYIWDKFSKVYISESVKPQMKLVTEILRGMAHRPFNSDSKQYRLFLEGLNKSILSLEKSPQHLDFRKEKEDIAERIKKIKED